MLDQPSSVRTAAPRDAAATASAPTPLLEVEDLHVQFDTSRGVVHAVDGISYTVNRGEVVAIVGESGCGKSVSALAIMRPARQARRPGDRRAASCSKAATCSSSPTSEMREIRGRDISMIFQEPMTSLNPVLTIGEQIMEPLFIHLKMTRRAGATRARSNCCSSSASPTASGGSNNIRTSSPAACASA